MKLPRLVVIGGKLAIICTVAAVVLGLINAVTAPVIVANREKALMEGLAQIAEGANLPQARIGEGVSAEDSREVAESEAVDAVYPIIAASGDAGGYILQLTGTGYGGEMSLLAGYYPDGEVFAAQLMENQETPGLGKKAEEPEYMNMFMGTGGAEPVPTGKTDLPPAQADAITGATITFLGIARALEEGSRFVTTTDDSLPRSDQ